MLSEEQQAALRPIRFCEKCGRNVKVFFRQQSAPMPIYGRLETISFPVAYCPFCESVLCERGFDELFLEAVLRRKAEIEAETLQDVGESVNPQRKGGPAG